MALTVTLIIIISFSSPTLSFIPDKTFLFCKSFPLQPFFFSSGLTIHDSPDFYSYF